MRRVAGGHSEEDTHRQLVDALGQGGRPVQTIRRYRLVYCSFRNV